MQSNRSKSLRLAAAFAAALLPCACVSHQHVVGLGPTGSGATSARQFYILFGLMQINEVNVQRMASDLTSYSIESEFSWMDLLVAPVLLPFTATSRTVTVRT